MGRGKKRGGVKATNFPAHCHTTFHAIAYELNMVVCGPVLSKFEPLTKVLERLLRSTRHEMGRQKARRRVRTHGGAEHQQHFPNCSQ